MKTEKLNARSLRKLREEQAVLQALVPNKLRAIRWISNETNRCCNLRGGCYEERFEELFVAHLEDLKDPNFLRANKRYLLSTKRTLYTWLREKYTSKSPVEYIVPGYRVFCWECFKEGQRWEAKLAEVRLQHTTRNSSTSMDHDDFIE